VARYVGPNISHSVARFIGKSTIAGKGKFLFLKKVDRRRQFEITMVHRVLEEDQ